MTNFTGCTIPKTIDFLEKNGLHFDSYDGVVSLFGEDYNVKSPVATMTFRKVAFSLSVYQDAASFSYSTTKDSRIVKSKDLKHKNAEEWFDLFESAARILAKELGLKKILVSSGKKDKDFLEGKGYVKQKRYFFEKTI